MNYELFLFDLDDTLLDFKESEKLSFFATMKSLGIGTDVDQLYSQYQTVNRGLWKLFELGQTSKDHLKVERFRKLFELNNFSIDPELASRRYLETLPQTVVLIEYAKEICEWLTQYGEIGIITNGIHHTQTERIKNSALAPYISFVSVSEESGFAKPDVRFFEYSAKMAKKFSKPATLMIGDRLETDILGAKNFGLDSCWFNPDKTPGDTEILANYEISHLSELQNLLSK